jgi:hypothetical protein
MTEVQIDQTLEEAASLQSLVEVTADQIESNSSKTGVARSAEISDAIVTKNVDELMKLQDRLSSIITTIMCNEIDIDSLGLMSDDDLQSCARELVDQKDVKRLIEVRYGMLRTAFFAHITKLNEMKGTRDPQHDPGEVLIPILNKRITREGGKKIAKLDRAKLKEQLTDEQWQSIHTAHIVPAVAEHIEYELDEDKLLALVQKTPKVMSVFSDCVKISGRTPQKLNVRDPKEQTDHEIE